MASSRRLEFGRDDQPPPRAPPAGAGGAHPPACAPSTSEALACVVLEALSRLLSAPALSFGVVKQSLIACERALSVTEGSEASWSTLPGLLQALCGNLREANAAPTGSVGDEFLEELTLLLGAPDAPDAPDAASSGAATPVGSTLRTSDAHPAAGAGVDGVGAGDDDDDDDEGSDWDDWDDDDDDAQESGGGGPRLEEAGRFLRGVGHGKDRMARLVEAAAGLPAADGALLVSALRCTTATGDR